MTAVSRPIIADPVRLRQSTWNRSYGNRLLHLLFVLALCERHNRPPLVPCDSVLDEIFDLTPLKPADPRPYQRPRYAFRETSAFGANSWRARVHRLLRRPPPAPSLQETIAASAAQFAAEKHFLGGPVPDGAFAVKGHFWHIGLMPTADTFRRYLPLRSDLRQAVLARYPDLQAPGAVAVHLRDTDFRHHLRGTFRRSIMLDDAYYRRAIDRARETLGGEITFHLFSDNRERIERLFAGQRYVLHEDNAALDWVGLHLAPHIIQSNSSFCWTAALYGKQLNIQPAGGYNYYENSGDVPYGFAMPHALQIARAGEVTTPV